MSDPLSNGTRALDASSADKDAKIEHLLLVGLDHYFAQQYEQAINVWTRALFFDRNHARARAYIDRARSALAERQRRSEELLQTGVAAFQRGESSEARRLLHAAIDGGAPADEALAVLDRLDRLEAAVGQAPARAVRSRQRPSAGATRSVSSSLAWMLAGSLVLTFAIALAIAGASKRVDWHSWIPLATQPAATRALPVTKETTLPPPRRGEVTLARANALALNGKLSDALAALDTVPATDPARPAADRLRADLQHQLIALGRVP
jgi:tetratricopeptide (TPR) repeat protein